MSKKPYGVLILHGFTSSLDCVNGIEPPIQALGLPTRMPTLRGHGAPSPEALRGVTWRDWVTDAQAALQSLLSEAERAIVFGHSMGGLVTLNLAADHAPGGAPGAIDSIIVAGVPLPLTTPFSPGKPLTVLVPLIRLFIKKFDFAPNYADPALAQYNTNYRWAPTDAIASLFDLMRVTRRRLPEVRTPTLIIHSRRDTTADPRSAETIYHGISTPPEQKRLIWFEKTDHEMFRDCEREATVQAVVDYVKERAGRNYSAHPAEDPGG